MTAKEFNEKYAEYIEEGFYGLEVDIEPITQWLDGIMNILIKIPDFKICQIKLKFDMFRFYSNQHNMYFELMIEDKLNDIYDCFKKEEKLGQS